MYGGDRHAARTREEEINDRKEPSPSNLAGVTDRP